MSWDSRLQSAPIMLKGISNYPEETFFFFSFLRQNSWILHKVYAVDWRLNYNPWKSFESEKIDRVYAQNVWFHTAISSFLLSFSLSIRMEWDKNGKHFNHTFFSMLLSLEWIWASHFPLSINGVYSFYRPNFDRLSPTNVI